MPQALLVSNEQLLQQSEAAVSMKCGVKVRSGSQGGHPHHASGPAVHHLSQAELELAYKLLSRLCYPTLPLQLPDSLGHRQHAVDALEGEKQDKVDKTCQTHQTLQAAPGCQQEDLLPGNLCFFSSR